MPMKFFSTVLVALLLLCFACRQGETRQAVPVHLADTLQKANRKIVTEEKFVIEAFLKRKGWNYQKTGTGLYFYPYYSPQKDSLLRNGDRVWISFSLEDIRGNVFYDVFHKRNIQFVIGHDDVEAGIHEVMLNLKKGDKCYVLLPPHLAFGLTGTEDIPPYTILLYNLEVKDVKRQQ
jgi:FKBP-type peptidyl-prolyl cis-trans isomerase